jgi:two-component system, NtrC family, response regulator AtoC
METNWIAEVLTASDVDHPRVFVLSRRPMILEQDPLPFLASCDVSLFSDVSEFKRTLESGGAPDLVVMDWDTPNELHPENAADFIARLHASHCSIPIIMLPSATPKAGSCPTAFRVPGCDAALKLEECDRTEPGLRSKPEVFEISIDADTSFVRASKCMRDVESQCRLVARTNIPMLILGESGTGKEVAAKLVHKLSARSHRPFLKVNCAAMPTDLLESELFGYEQGAFTGAVRSKPGKFEMCNYGTIFLDEIGEMPCALQAKLLQVLQDGSFSRLGGRSPVKVDVRVIAATNIDMITAIREKTFREDLYYRLNGFSLRMPPLRERPEEIPVLTHHFARKASAAFACPPLPFSDKLMNALIGHTWPGNLRELENVIKRYLVLADEQAIIRDLRPQPALDSSLPRLDDGCESGNLKNLARHAKGNAESAAIASSLEETGWNRKAAAVDLQISYKALLYKIKQYNLEPPRKRLAGSAEI